MGWNSISAKLEFVCVCIISQLDHANNLAPANSSAYTNRRSRRTIWLHNARESRGQTNWRLSAGGQRWNLLLGRQTYRPAHLFCKYKFCRFCVTRKAIMGVDVCYRLARFTSFAHSTAQRPKWVLINGKGAPRHARTQLDFCRRTIIIPSARTHARQALQNVIAFRIACKSEIDVCQWRPNCLACIDARIWKRSGIFISNKLHNAKICYIRWLLIKLNWRRNS